MTFRVTAYEHVGIRVSVRAISTAFHEKLGWHEEIDLPEHRANEMVDGAGVHINLIFNGTAREGGFNVLQDEPVKHPGMTHAAFVIEDMQALLALGADEGMRITDGPVVCSGRRTVVFPRDPDGNVLEFNEPIEGPAT